jgi:hypothetical protein
MQFNPAVHTKEFLMANDYVAFDLAKKSSDFALSELANDAEILGLKTLAAYTVAHLLARYQPQWASSDAAKDPVILELKNYTGETVAHHLARFQPQWLSSDVSKDYNILIFADDIGMTVAQSLIRNNEESINHEPLFHKKILSLSDGPQLFAEFITEMYGESHGLDTSTMAMKMISQGAAYKHSISMPLEVGETLLKQAKSIADDSMESLVTLKKLQALYSTFYHQVENIKTAEELKYLDGWLSMLARAEGMLADHLNASPALLDIEHTVDIFCEPSDDFLKRLASEHAMKNGISLATGSEAPIQEMRSNTGLY